MNITAPLTYKDLKEAVAGTAAGFRARTRLKPAGGDGDKVFPPTYEGGEYATEDRESRKGSITVERSQE